MSAAFRDPLFEEADSLRDGLSRLELLASAVEAGSEESMEALRMLGLELLDLLAGRIAQEQWVLLPALRASLLPDARRHAERLEREHQRQGRMLGDQLDVLVDRRLSPRIVARGAGVFARHMRAMLDDAVHLAAEPVPHGMVVEVEVA